MRQAAVLGVLLTMAVGAAPALGRQATFKAETRLVPIPVTVTGRDGRLLAGLRQEDFRLFVDGRPAPIAVFSDAPTAAVVVALWDVSNSMASHRALLRPLAREFVRALWPDDRARLGTFGQELALSPHLTADQQILQRVIDEEFWFSGGGTPLWQTIAEAVDAFPMPVPSTRRVLLLVTDGGASDDDRHRQAALRRLHQEHVTVYVVAIGRPGRAAAGLARETGGAVVTMPEGPERETQWARVVAEIHQQYTLGFTSSIRDGLPHRLEVRTTIAGATTRSREIFWASKDQN